MPKRSRSDAGDDIDQLAVNNVEMSDAEEDETFVNETLRQPAEEVADLIDPKTMLDLMISFEQYVKASGKGTSHRVTPAMAADFLKTTEYEGDVDAPKFLRSFKEFSARANKEIDLSITISCNLIYLRNGSSAKLFPGYPKAPPSLMDHYAAKYNLSRDVRNRGDLKAKMIRDVQGREECENELLELEKKFVAQLDAFLDSHRDKMHSKQIDFVNDQLKKAHRKFAATTPRAPKAKKTKEDKKDVTPLDLYKKTVPDKYSDLDPEARDKKLAKKFAKLPDEQRDIFEKLAMAASPPS